MTSCCSFPTSCCFLNAIPSPSQPSPWDQGQRLRHVFHESLKIHEEVKLVKKEVLASATSGSLRSPSMGAGLGKLRHSLDLGPHPTPWHLCLFGRSADPLYPCEGSWHRTINSQWMSSFAAPWEDHLSFALAVILEMPKSPHKMLFLYMPPHVHVSSTAGENFPCECLLTLRRSHWTRARLVFCHGTFCSVSGFRRSASLTSVPLAKRDTLWK